MTIPAYRLPENIERGSKFGPAFRNVIQEAISGNEQRFAQWTKCRATGDLSYGLLTSGDPLGDFRAILSLWRGHFGSMYPFRFRDWGDYIATHSVFGTGDGALTTFQLSMTYDPQAILLGTAGSFFYVRSITLLATDVTPSVYINNVLQTSGYSISSSGLVTFTTAPAAATQLTWSGEFDVPVRFDTDQLPIVLNEADLASVSSIPIKEVIGES
jgi:uncharacterized protein (TIGR02217 family)